MVGTSLANRLAAHLRRGRQWWLTCEGRVDWPRLPVGATFEGEQLGRWAAGQRAGWADLVGEQRELLGALGIEGDQVLAAAKATMVAKAKTSRADRFALGLAALAAFAEREGHVRVSRAHREDGLALGTWLNNTRARRAGLTAEQRGQLEALGVTW
ncbi:helicase associated domain-containing protein [Kitasatospora sp. LaBMicrA B282]|uniref:helicase associated domain-containing protein n=1 Tax=Kitasatospora sp. LaBMicrA B282 TaxID=3420949 RepID=UPI003D0A6D34